MTAGAAASRHGSGRTPVAPPPASGLKRPAGINGRTSAPTRMSLPEVCSLRLPLTRGNGLAPVPFARCPCRSPDTVLSAASMA